MVKTNESVPCKTYEGQREAFAADGEQPDICSTGGVVSVGLQTRAAKIGRLAIGWLKQTAGCDGAESRKCRRGRERSEAAEG